MFQELLSYLKSLELYYKTAHWQVKNPIYYSDHLLLDRLSDESGKRIDEVAEKAIGVTGSVASVNLPEILKKVYGCIKDCPYESNENSKYFEAALHLEEKLQQLCKQFDQAPETSVGVKNMLGDIADESEGRIYLLKQRLSK